MPLQCNETHSGGVGQDSQHKSRCHRPKGFAGYTVMGTNKFTATFCNDSVKSNDTFQNSATNGTSIPYKDYRTVNDYYKSWNIEGVASDDSLY